MQVFVTGASGWIGSAVVSELLDAGHDVVGLARSDQSAAALEAIGVGVHRGSLDDLDSLRAGADDADGVVHLAFKHDFDDYAAAGRSERAAVETMLTALEGSGRPFLLASGIAVVAPGRIATEEDRSAATGPEAPRGGGEALALGFADRGVRSVGLRFAPTVHGAGDHGFVATLVDVARRQGASCYVGDGTNRWSAVHRADAAHMVRLALDRSPAGSAVHGVAEEGIATRTIAEVIGRHLGVPVTSVAPDDQAEHFGWIGHFFSLDIPASNTITRQVLDWTPTHPTLLEDLESGSYFR